MKLVLLELLELELVDGLMKVFRRNSTHERVQEWIPMTA